MLVVAVDPQPAEAVVHGELGHLGGDALLGMQREVGGRDPQRQRQHPAQPGQLAGRVGLGIDPAPAEHPAEQHVRLRRGERVECDVHGAVPGDQTPEPVPAGHDHDAAGAAGQQRPHLLGGARVIEHNEHPPVGERGAVERGCAIQVGRDLVGADAERRQETGEGLDRLHRRGRGVAAKVHVELAVGEPIPHPGRPVHG